MTINLVGPDSPQGNARGVHLEDETVMEVNPCFPHVGPIDHFLRSYTWMFGVGQQEVHLTSKALLHLLICEGWRNHEKHGCKGWV